MIRVVTKQSILVVIYATINSISLILHVNARIWAAKKKKKNGRKRF